MKIRGMIQTEKNTTYSRQFISERRTEIRGPQIQWADFLTNLRDLLGHVAIHEITFNTGLETRLDINKAKCDIR